MSRRRVAAHLPSTSCPGGRCPVGPCPFHWNGRNRAGRRVRPGRYRWELLGGNASGAVLPVAGGRRGTVGGSFRVSG
jgi:flagellar hook assembly protein FlgD